MAKIVGYIATSLDGMIADKNDSLDWLFAYDGMDLGAYDYNKFLKRIQLCCQPTVRMALSWKAGGCGHIPSD